MPNNFLPIGSVIVQKFLKEFKFSFQYSDHFENSKKYAHKTGDGTKKLQKTAFDKSFAFLRYRAFLSGNSGDVYFNNFLNL